MLARRLLSLFVVASSACIAFTGCAVDATDDEVVEVGDGFGGAASALVGERQLSGNELPTKTISLTFDDGPGRRTSELADYLAANGIKATFFINGMNVPGRQAALDTVATRGHLIANHTQNHKQLTLLSAAAVVKEIADTDAFIEQVQPGGPWIIRAPFGAWNANVSRALNASPMQKYVGSVFWDEGGQLTETAAADWDCWAKRVSVERCAALYLQEIRAKKRGVVLMHDIHDKTVDMIKLLVPELLADGFEFAGLEDVPSVKRALAAAAEPAVSADQCASATLARRVEADVCVQASGDHEWYRCVDGEWHASSPTDATCKTRYPL